MIIKSVFTIKRLFALGGEQANKCLLWCIFFDVFSDCSHDLPAYSFILMIRSNRYILNVKIDLSIPNNSAHPYNFVAVLDYYAIKRLLQ
ncbi:hypothetical protein D3C75_1134470 [compost metagenome]